MKIQDITRYLESIAPLSYQEDYDNAGLITGQPKDEVRGILIALDSTEEVLEEAIRLNCNMVIAHHPIVFRGLKKLNGRNYVERTVIKAIQNNIALYAIHTNLDNVHKGVNAKIASILGLQNTRILDPKKQKLMKLTTFVPLEHTDQLLEALGNAGAGQIGEYKNCSFRTEGIGTFEPSETANPFIGEANQKEEVNENRIEVIFPVHLERNILNTLLKTHPYEEVAYYLHLLENKNQELGSGMIGQLPEAMGESEFLHFLKEKMRVNTIRHTAFLGKKVEKIALCGGSGSFILGKAIEQQADVYLSADFKYHEFFDADQKIMIADIGHYESEQFTIDLLYDWISGQWKDIPLYKTQCNTNPIQYFH